jgi:hypothetical protein
VICLPVDSQPRREAKLQSRLDFGIEIEDPTKCCMLWSEKKFHILYLTNEL